MTTPAAATSVPIIQRPEQKMAGHIRDAAEATGVPFEFLLAQANQESRLDPNARNGRSSAQGLFQFTAGTWLDMVKRHGAEHGLGDYAEMIVKGPDGRLTIKDKDLKKDVLDLRKDPHLSAVMAAEYAKDNEKVLESKLGRQVSTHDLYLAHFLGAGGAIKMLRGLAQPADTPHPPELASAARANPEIFQGPEGETRSLDAIYQSVEKRFRRAMTDAAAVAGKLRPQVDLAALKPAARPDAEPVAVAAPSARDRVTDRPHPATATPAAGTVARVALTSAAFPAPLPAHIALTAPLQEQDGLAYPVRLPPPVSGTRADADTLRGLMTMLEENG